MNRNSSMKKSKAIRFLIGLLPLIASIRLFQNRLILSYIKVSRKIGILILNLILNPAVIFPKKSYSFQANFNSDVVTPLVSIVLPVFNHGQFLRASIQSVLNQEYRNFELIIVNDGSTDNTDQVLREFSTNQKVKLLTQPNSGLPVALNKGFDIAKGQFFTCTSADNLMAPTALKILVDALIANKDVGLVYADFTVIDEKGDEIKRSNTWRNYDRTGKDPSIVKLSAPKKLYKNIPDNFIGPYFLYRQVIAKKLIRYGNIPGIEDWDYWLRMQFITIFKHINTDGKQYHYRVHLNSMSSKIKASNQMLNTVLLLRNITKQRIGSKDMQEKIGPTISEKCFTQMVQSTEANFL